MYLFALYSVDNLGQLCCVGGYPQLCTDLVVKGIRQHINGGVLHLRPVYSVCGHLNLQPPL